MIGALTLVGPTESYALLVWAYGLSIAQMDLFF